MKQILIALALFSTPLHAANFAFVQGRALSHTFTAAFSSGNTSGNFIVAVAVEFNLTSISDSKGNSYTCKLFNTGVSVGNFCYATGIANGSNTVAIVGSGTGFAGDFVFQIEEYSSASPTFSFSNAFGSIGASVAGPAVTSGSEVLAVLASASSSCPGSWTITSGTIFGTDCSFVSDGSAGAWDIRSSLPMTYSNTWSAGGGNFGILVLLGGGTTFVNTQLFSTLP